MNLITRELGIDMAHRVPNHGSKCRNLHGHRYTVHATLEGGLVSAGEQEGMVMDFGFLKELMMEHIDAPCDHGTCLWVGDPLLRKALGPMWHTANEFVAHKPGHLMEWDWGKLYVVRFIPTAENLARHWFHLLWNPVMERSGGGAQVHSVKVWETPNCSAEYGQHGYRG